ncbi:FAD-dependent oxidoreductase [Niabella terrae]
MANAVIIGGGICGLSSAWYLHRSGWEVTVLDQFDFSDNCSYGNMGFVCPSHFIQLASPAIVRQGIQWMLNSRSPFYIQPRFSRSLLGWVRAFLTAATNTRVQQHGVPLRDIGLLSRHEYEHLWQQELDFEYRRNGMLEIFRTQKGKRESAEVVAFGKRLGLDIDLVDSDQLQQLEPQTQINALGAVHYKCDGYLDPNGMMQALHKKLIQQGVQLVSGACVQDVQISAGRLEAVRTATTAYTADAFVLAAGACSGALARKLQLKLPMVGGRGYSLTLPISHPPMDLQHPGILLEGRCAFTPVSPGKIRFGGTMEITALNTAPRYERVKTMLRAVQDFFPEIEISYERIVQDIWSGFRPVSGDGMPYIGSSSKWQNLVIATGHAQLGISLGAATGLLVAEILNGNPLSVDIRAFSPGRFG